MLRIHFLHQWYGLSDPAMEEELYEIASMRQFAGLSLARGTVPDETTIQHDLVEFALANIWIVRRQLLATGLSTPEEGQDSDNAGTSPHVQSPLRPFATASDVK
jgi:hypothetical protein